MLKRQRFCLSILGACVNFREGQRSLFRNPIVSMHLLDGEHGRIHTRRIRGVQSLCSGVTSCERDTSNISKVA
jgi:hypothetical protein